MSHPDLRSEQAWLDAAYAHLEAMRRRVAANVAIAGRMARDEQSADARVVQDKLEHRQAALAAEGGPLCFGRIDTEEADRWYVGRRHIEDDQANAIIVDWRAPVAAAFYRATAADPFGLTFRRRFSLDGASISAIFDEDLEDPDSLSAAGIPDPLLAELDRSRSGQMRDIVATIAAEQDEIIRAPIDDLLIVQGGPGTGKTAVGLHRAAFLLFQHRQELSAGIAGGRSDNGVLVIGPNPVFLRYIAEVLPSLGEVSVRQATLTGLVAAKFKLARPGTNLVDCDQAVRTKGSAAMAAVVAAAIRSSITAPADGLTVRSGLAVVRFTEQEVESLIKTTLSGSIPVNQGREVFRRLVLAEAWRRFSSKANVDGGGEPAFVSGARADKGFKASVDKLWPSLSPAAIVAKLYSSPTFLARAADGLLPADEQQALRRKVKAADRGRWTSADIPLLDEADAICSGVAATYGHVVVDEAQDLSPMGLRMVGRRSVKGSMTVLGDLAQATAIGAPGTWEGSIEALLTAVRSEAPVVHTTELTVGYRVPDSIIELANRLLPEAAPTVTPVASVRAGGLAPRRIAVSDPASVAATVAAEVGEVRTEAGSVAVIATERWHSPLEAELAALGVAAAGPGSLGQGLPGTESVAIVDPLTAKGLEFDAVIVVEPGEIAAMDSGLRHLYVAMTRPVQQLRLVYAEPLPAALVN